MKRTVLFMVFMTLMNIVWGQTHWTVITGTQYNMTVKGIIVIDGVTQANNQLEIGAFCGEECRGSRKAALFPPTGEYPVMLTVVSNVYSGETITFRIYDHSTQQELDLQSETTLTFEHNTNAGNMGNWFQFVFTTPAVSNTTTGDWSDPTVWGGTAPTPEANVQINTGNVTIGDNGAATVTVASLEIVAGATLTVESGSTLVVTGDLTNANEDGLVIEDGAQVVNESANVKATYRKDITSYNAKSGGGWYTISSPVDGMAIAGSGFVTPEYDLYRYNENPDDGMEWENYKAGITDFTTFESGRGYLYANSNTFTPAFEGTLNAAAVTRQLTCTANPDGLSGFNLIGNPFPHDIYKGVGGAIEDASLASGYYTLNDDGLWQTHTYEDAIRPGQGILVKTVANTSLAIAKSVAAATAENGGAKAVSGRLGITVKGDGDSADRAFAYFGPGIGLEKMGGFGTAAPCVFVRSGQDYAIAHVGQDEESLEVCFQNSQDADFHLSVDMKDIDFGYLQLYDDVTGTVTDLMEEPEYVFHADGTETEARFKLMFRVTTGVEEMTEDEPFAFISNGNLIVNGEGTLQIFDVIGRQLYVKQVSPLTSNLSPFTSPGVYVLRLIDGNGTRTQKVVVR